MTIEPPANPTPDPLAARRVELSARPVGIMIITISAIAGLISLAVVIGTVVIAVTGGTVPDVLSNWGGIILGFYFGQFITLAKDYMGVVKQ